MFKFVFAALLMLAPVATAQAQAVPPTDRPCVTASQLIDYALATGFGRNVVLRGVSLDEFLANLGAMTNRPPVTGIDIVIAFYHPTEATVMLVPFVNGCVAANPMPMPRPVFERLRGRVADAN